MNSKVRDRAVGCLLGLAIGDAMGAPLEFSSRTDEEYSPVTDFRAGGPFNLEAGYWTDDTSQALCLADSLLSRGYMDATDFATRLCNWWSAGYNSSTGKCFDIGHGTVVALHRFAHSGEIRPNPLSAGNGCIMRLAPVPIMYLDSPGFSRALEESCKVTHSHQDALDSTIYLGYALNDLILGTSPKNLQVSGHYQLPKSSNLHQKVCELSLKLLQGSDVEKEFYDPSGYSIDSLIASLYCFFTTSSFKECLLKAVNLCGDSDSVGAITGQLAGAFYGLSGIPQEWVQGLYDSERLLTIGESLFQQSRHKSNYKI